MTTSDIRLSESIAPVFHQIHKDIKSNKYTHFNLLGGRGSTKSSFVSIEVLLLIKQHPKAHALIMRKVAATLRDSVYAQYLWAIDLLGLQNEFKATVSPMEITYRPTGQKILFRGADDKFKLKSIKVPFGYIAITHFEEKDQFAGREEIRTILQSTMRGGELYWNFETNNPPISASNWANKDALLTRPDRITHYSNYQDVPREWLGEQFFFEAEQLKLVNEKAYRHEYGGEAVGTGGNIFENVLIQTITDDQLLMFDRRYRGIDWGYYPDPFAYVDMMYYSAQRTLYIVDEYTAYKRSNLATANELKDKGVDPNELITADNAEPKSIGDYRDYGFYIRGVEKFPGSVDYTMKWLQGLKAIIIDADRCPNTAKEFLEYEYERTKDGEIMTGYPDSNNHHIDAVRYAMAPVWRRRGK